jgi:hypothetical protein
VLPPARAKAGGLRDRPPGGDQPRGQRGSSPGGDGLRGGSRRNRTDDRLFTRQLLLPAELESLETVRADHRSRTDVSGVEARCLTVRPSPHRKGCVALVVFPRNLRRTARAARTRRYGQTEVKSTRVFEQVGGVEPSDSGVAHRCVTATLRLLGGLSRDLGLRTTVGARCASDDSFVGPVGFEPTPVGLRNRCKIRFATDPWSHPLESNQNLSGFSRARRPTTQEWDVSAARPVRASAALEFQAPLPGHLVIALQLS